MSVAVAAAIVLASLGILGRFLLLHPAAMNSASTGTGSSTLVQSASWSSIVLMYRLADQTIISNYEPSSEQNFPLAQLSSAQVMVDGVAHNGDQVLYHVFDGRQTRYYLYPQTQQAMYSVNGQGGPAIWSGGDNDHYLFISTLQGVVQLDMLSHTSRLLLSASGGVQALFSRDNYLYYVQSANTTPYSSTGTLYRVNIAQSNAISQQITSCPQSTNFWVNPVGTLIYYQCLSQNRNALYAINVDGTLPQLLRPNGQLVGYAADNSLLLVQLANDGRYQILQLGATVHQDHIILSNIAPGALSVRQSDIAVAPFGSMLVAKGTYAHSEEKLWYSDLLTQGTQQVQIPDGAHNVNLIGWDKLVLAA